MEGAAYLPLLDQLRQTGLTCVLVEMPFRLAIFDADAAEDVMAQFPDIEHWYIAGPSLGGAVASQFAADHPNEIDGPSCWGPTSMETTRPPTPSPSTAP